MKAQKLDGVEVWKQLEDVAAPRLKLSVLDRAVYSHLLRHTCLEGKLRLRFAIDWLAKNMGVTSRRARQSVRRLVDIGALRLIERSNIGHVVTFACRTRSAARAPTDLHPAAPISTSSTFGERVLFARPSTPAKVAGASIVFVGPPAAPTAWIMSSRSRRAGPIPTAIWLPAAWTVTHARGISPPPTFSVGSTASAACLARISPDACTPCRPSPPASFGRSLAVGTMMEKRQGKENKGV